MKALKITLVCLLTIIIGCAGWGWYTYRRFIATPAGSNAEPVTIEILSNETFSGVAQRLKNSGVVTNVFKFKALARWRGMDKRLKAGEYELNSAMTPPEVLDALVNGDVLLHRITIPEGYTIRDIAAEIERAGLGEANAFIDLAMDPGTAAQLDVPAANLEGYLFPDTYLFPKGVTAQTIINLMVGRFNEQFTPAWRQRAQQIGMSIHEVVTLASIIEKETGDNSERPVISSVFHNRLKKKMRLASDPTVIYGLKDFDGNITRRHLTTRTKYNTYLIDGLPPGPIANPGRLSIEAALYPAQTDYYYFVSKKDGTHYFSKTIEEHNRAIRRYQLSHRK